MKIKLPWPFKSNKAQTSEMERLLESTLKPIKPRPSFIKELKHEIVGSAENKIFGRIPPKTVRLGLLGLGAVLSGTFLFVAGIRWFVTLLSALGLIHLHSKNRKNQSSLPNQPAI